MLDIVLSFDTRPQPLLSHNKHRLGLLAFHRTSDRMSSIRSSHEGTGRPLTTTLRIRVRRREEEPTDDDECKDQEKTLFRPPSDKDERIAALASLLEMYRVLGRNEEPDIGVSIRTRRRWAAGATDLLVAWSGGRCEVGGRAGLGEMVVLLLLLVGKVRGVR